MGRPQREARILGPTWIPSREQWRVILARPRQRRRHMWFKEEADARRINSVDAFLAALPAKRHRRSYRKPESVYFIRAGEDGPVKIGKAWDVIRRLNGLQAACWVELRLLATSQELTERAMHERFAHLRIRGEWFRAESELLEFIKPLRV
jgi:hypothetical protein